MKNTHDQQYLVDSKGNRRALVIDIDDYQRLIEDIANLKTIAERKTNPMISPLQLITRLKKHGAL